MSLRLLLSRRSPISRLVSGTKAVANVTATRSYHLRAVSFWRGNTQVTPNRFQEGQGMMQRNMPLLSQLRTWTSTAVDPTTDGDAEKQVSDALPVEGEAERPNQRRRNERGAERGPPPPSYPYNARMSEAVKARTFEVVFEVAAEMKEAAIAPNANTYQHLIRVCEEFRWEEKAFEYYEEMLSLNIRPNVNLFNSLIRVAARLGHVDRAFSIIEQMEKYRVSPNVFTYSWLIMACSNGNETTRAFKLHEIMQQNRIQPNRTTYIQLINAAVRARDVERGFDFLVAMENNARDPGERTYRSLLDSALNGDELDFAVYAYRALITLLGEEAYFPVGVYSKLLHTAARRGNAEVANEIFGRIQKQFGASNSVFSPRDTTAAAGGEEESTAGSSEEAAATPVAMSPLLSVFYPYMLTMLRADNLKAAFTAILDLHELAPTVSLGWIMREITDYISVSTERADNAFYIIEELKNDGRILPTSAANVVVSACSELGDIDRCFATYQEYATLGVSPDVHTFNALIRCCMRRRQLAAAVAVFEDMKKLEIQPNARTYAGMVAAAVRAGDTNKAQELLAEFEAGVGPTAPSAEPYLILVRKLARDGRSSEAHDLMNQMEAKGLEVSGNLRDYVANPPEPRQPAREWNNSGRSGERQHAA